MYKLVKVAATDTGNGYLRMFNRRDALPFDVVKVLVISGMRREDVRGEHALRTTREGIIAVQGGCDVSIDNGSTIDHVTLHTSDEMLLILSPLWLIFNNFIPGTILIVVTDHPYDEDDYIRDYDTFLRFIKLQVT